MLLKSVQYKVGFESFSRNSLSTQFTNKLGVYNLSSHLGVWFPNTAARWINVWVLCQRAYFQMFLHEFLLGMLGPSVLELVICFIEVIMGYLWLNSVIKHALGLGHSCHFNWKQKWVVIWIPCDMQWVEKYFREKL